MKSRYLILTLLAVSAAAASAVSPKRGVGENSFSLGCQIEALQPGVSWYYNWGNSAPTGYQNSIEEADMEFVPMCWNGNYDADKIRNYVKSHPKTKYLLGFNEPNFKSQANLTPSEAAERWPAVKALADELGLELVAPALNYSPDAPYTDPTRWMDEFVALVGLDAFDYTAIHNYGGLGVMKTLSSKFWEKYHKPVWVTEFCFWPGGAGSVTVAPSTQISSMIESVEWLETTDYIHRYAWFKPIGQSSAQSGSPNYGLLLAQTSPEVSYLSEQGRVYVYMSDFDPERAHGLNAPFEATDYVSRNSASIATGANEACPVPIEISSFISGAWLDYRFEVPEEGDYNIELTVSGVGEPTRFDPKLAVYEVSSAGEVGTCLLDGLQFSLSGSDTVYERVALPVHLSAGRQTLRIADANPYAPSGIHISMVNLTDVNGVESISADGAILTDVYSIDGLCVRRAVNVNDALTDLPAGCYIVAGKKIMVK